MKTFLLLFPFLLGCSQKEKEFTVLQWNIWQEGTVIPGGYDAIVNEIARLRPDFVTLRGFYPDSGNTAGIRL